MRVGVLVRLACLAALGAGAPPAPAFGQTTVAANAGEPWIVTASHWGKWPALAGAGALVTMAVMRNNDAKAARAELRDYCSEDATRCVTVPGPDGDDIYFDPGAEALYQEYAALTRQARGFLVGGQVGVLVTGAMFLIDLVYQRDGFDNIPYTPFELYSTPDRLGLSVRF